MGNKSQSIHERYLKPSVKDDLKKKMVFVGGPRQVGKTTFAQRFLKHPSPKHPAYLNWDLPQNRPTLLRGELPTNQKLIIFDEIHKFARWRNLIKGLYDHHHDQISFLITGSARLDYYRKGGDSLQGRYHYYRLHPFSLMELNRSPTSEDLKNLLHYGGFPEPLFAHSEQEWRRWSLERHQRVIYEDLADLERVKEVSMLELLLDALPDRVGAPLSIQNLRELLQVAHHTVERWITI
jgi:predicted AAA+ superfamily ATPase